MLFLSFTNKGIQSGICEMVLETPTDQVYVPFCGLLGSILTTDDQFALDLCEMNLRGGSTTVFSSKVGRKLATFSA